MTRSSPPVVAGDATAWRLYTCGRPLAGVSPDAPRARVGDAAAAVPPLHRSTDPPLTKPTTPMSRLLCLLVATLTGVALAGDARAQTPDATPPGATGWGGSAVSRTETFTADRAPWRESRVSAQRRWRSGAVGVEGGLVERHGRSAAIAAVDAYRVLSRRVYANVRVQAAPGAAIVPPADLLGEAYVSLGPGWDASAGVRHVVVPGEDVTLAVASLARTAGDFVLRVRAVGAARPGPSLAAAVTLRYAPEASGRGPATRVDLTVGRGQEAVLEDDGAVTVRPQAVLAVSGQRAVAGPVGLSAGLAYTFDGTLTRWSAEAGLAVRL